MRLRYHRATDKASRGGAARNLSRNRGVAIDHGERLSVVSCILPTCWPFPNPASIRRLPGVVIRNLPAISAMYPSPISRALCSAGITAGGLCTAHLPTVSSEVNPSCVSIFGAGAIVRVWHPLRKLRMFNFTRIRLKRVVSVFKFPRPKKLRSVVDTTDGGSKS
jgi:hypothetical protein